ncbi:hypothetical protein [Hoyosella altamirensis]|uniref:Uncharacterized protein n=1 Tax=Hoyosella altamirensis TaxID=616997 RepID=A0A839RND8_9ACTN|nr:hypothetical protein [Hoyosella altamirensis]MBB3038010.1 hypothetical protein [Hoyosella altamirensis]
MSASRLTTFFRTPFGLAVAALVVLAGWSLWTAGIADNDLQRTARSGSVYAAAGVDLDTEAAAEIIGNRRLFVAFLEPDADLSRACSQVSGPARGTLALLVSRKEGGDGYNSYGCSQLPGEGTEAFGRAFVAESMIRRGINVFADRPLEALKVTVVNYDMLVKAGTVPDHARTISPSLPRYLIALAAVTAVLAGSAFAYLGARRAGKLAGQRAQSRAAASDAQSSLNVKAAVLAKHILDLDRRYEGAARHRGFGAQYRAIVADYTDLVDELAEEKGSVDDLATRMEDLISRCRELNSGR